METSFFDAKFARIGARLAQVFKHSSQLVETGDGWQRRFLVVQTCQRFGSLLSALSVEENPSKPEEENKHHQHKDSNDKPEGMSLFGGHGRQDIQSVACGSEVYPRRRMPVSTAVREGNFLESIPLEFD
jgi:hypothetical protein